MKRRDIVIGLAIVALVIGLLYFRNRSGQNDLRVPEDNQVSSSSTEQRIEEIFGTEIPEDVDKAELSAVGGGDGSAIATRDEENGSTRVAVLADLPDPESGKFYQVWLEKSESERISLGRMSMAKGGWVIDQTSTQNLEEHGKVIVSLEESADNTLEQVVLEGEF